LKNGVHQSRISPWGNPTPFSSRGDVGAPHIATLSLPWLAIGSPIWIFSASVLQNTMILEQSNQQPDDTRVTLQPYTSSVSPSPSSSSLGETMFQKNDRIKVVVINTFLHYVSKLRYPLI